DVQGILVSPVCGFHRVHNAHAVPWFVRPSLEAICLSTRYTTSVRSWYPAEAPAPKRLGEQAGNPKLIGMRRKTAKSGRQAKTSPERGCKNCLSTTSRFNVSMGRPRALGWFGRQPLTKGERVHVPVHDGDWTKAEVIEVVKEVPKPDSEKYKVIVRE